MSDYSISRPPPSAVSHLNYQLHTDTRALYFPADRLALHIRIHHTVYLFIDVSVCLLNNLRFIQKTIIYFHGVSFHSRSFSLCCRCLMFRAGMFPLSEHKDRCLCSLSNRLNFLFCFHLIIQCDIEFTFASVFL